jgi:hypothetical protein
MFGTDQREVGAAHGVPSSDCSASAEHGSSTRRGHDRGSIVPPARSMGLPLGRGWELLCARQANVLRFSGACTAPLRLYA